jgi:hypothetical protein
MCAPALRKAPHDQLMILLKTLDKIRLLNNDSTVSEYCLLRLLIVEISDIVFPPKNIHTGNLRLKDLKGAVSLLVAAVSSSSQSDVAIIKRAYIKGMSLIFQDASLPMPVVTNFASSLDPVWADLENLCYSDKKLLIDTLTALIYSDGEMKSDEAELVRTLGFIMHIPLPSVVTL